VRDLQRVFGVSAGAVRDPRGDDRARREAAPRHHAGHHEPRVSQHEQGQLVGAQPARLVHFPRLHERSRVRNRRLRVLHQQGGLVKVARQNPLAHVLLINPKTFNAHKLTFPPEGRQSAENQTGRI